MAVTIKSQREIELMTEAGRILAAVHRQLGEELREGMSTAKVNQICEELIRGYGCIPSFLNYEGFPASVCVSINDVVVHGIPSETRFLQEGDLVSLDTGVIYKGYQSDAARSYIIGEGSEVARKLVEVTRQSFFEGVKMARAGNHLNDIGRAVQEYAESFGFGVIRDMVGHGIGQEMHEDPEIPNYRTPQRGIRLKAGMTLAIEPMLSAGSYEIMWEDDDDWTCYTADHSLAAHYENTILVTEGDPVILSL